MDFASPLSAQFVLDLAKEQGIQRGSLQASRTIAEAAGDVTVSDAVTAYNTLLILLEKAEFEIRGTLI